MIHKIEERKPTYTVGFLCATRISDPAKNLIFHGVDLDPVRLELIKEPTYCQDILEARIRSVLFEELNITRDIPLEKVVKEP